jgi:hypothetical protein
VIGRRPAAADVVKGATMSIGTLNWKFAAAFGIIR